MCKLGRPQSTDVLDFEPEEDEVSKTEKADEKEGDDVETGGGKPDWLNNVASPNRFAPFSHNFT